MNETQKWFHDVIKKQIFNWISIKSIGPIFQTLLPSFIKKIRPKVRKSCYITYRHTHTQSDRQTDTQIDKHTHTYTYRRRKERERKKEGKRKGEEESGRMGDWREIKIMAFIQGVRSYSLTVTTKRAMLSM